MAAASEQLGIEIFVNGQKANVTIQKISSGLTNLDKKSKESTEKSSWAMAKAVAMGNLLSQGISTLFGKMFEAIPALGETLSQAGTVFFRNLFKPLQDVLLPLLRDLMNWIRDNRVGFVKLGSVISGAFLFVFDIVKTIFRVIGSIFNKFFSAVTGGTKASFSSVAQFLNMLLLKIAFVVQFVFILIEPMIHAIADLFIWLGSNVIMPFVKGFLEGFSSIADSFNPLFEELGELWDDLKQLFGIFDENGSVIKDFFKDFGKTIGYIVAGPIKLIIEFIRLAVKAVYHLIDTFKTLINIGKGIGPAISDGFISAGNYITSFFGGIVDWVIQKFNSILDWFKELPALISKAVMDAYSKVQQLAGKVLNSVVNPFGAAEQGSMAMASGSAGNTNNTSSQNNNVNITLTGDQSNPEQAKRNAGMIADSVKDSLPKQQSAAGRR